MDELLYGPYWHRDELTDADRDKAIELLCRELGVAICRTTHTKHGNVEIELQKDEE